MKTDLWARLRAELERMGRQAPAHALLDSTFRWVLDPAWQEEVAGVPRAERLGAFLDLANWGTGGPLAAYVDRVAATLAGIGNVVAAGSEREVASAHLEHFFLSLADLVAGPEEWSAQRERVEIAGIEHLETALQRDKGAIMLSVTQSHPGFAFWNPHFDGIPVTGVANERLSNEVARSPLLASLARRVELVPPTPAAVRPMLRRLGEGGVVSIYVDFLFPQSRGTVVPLLGRSVLLSQSAAGIALKTGATVVPVSVARRQPWENDSAEVRFFPPLPLEDLARGDELGIERAATRMAVVVEALIRRDPAVWRLWGILPDRWRECSPAANVGGPSA